MRQRALRFWQGQHGTGWLRVEIAGESRELKWFFPLFTRRLRVVGFLAVGRAGETMWWDRTVWRNEASRWEPARLVARQRVRPLSDAQVRTLLGYGARHCDPWRTLRKEGTMAPDVRALVLASNVAGLPHGGRPVVDVEFDPNLMRVAAIWVRKALIFQERIDEAELLLDPPRFSVARVGSIGSNRTA